MKSKDDNLNKFSAKEQEGINNELVNLDLDFIKRTKGDLFYAIRALINRYDPIGLLALGAPEDEYDPEVKTIVYQVHDAVTVHEIQDLIYTEFLRWFGEESIIGSWESYHEIAIQLYTLKNESSDLEH
jgi:hypothetical protein